MPTSRKTIKKTKLLKAETAKVSRKLLVGLAVVAVVIVGVIILRPWEKFNLPFVAQKITIAKPKPDFGRARQMTIDPAKDSVMQVINKDGAIITLEVPKGALAEKTTVKLIPFYPEKNSKAPTSGVIISPANLSFTQPVTLSFNFSETNIKTDAPINAVQKSLHTTGKTHVMQLDANASELIPMLIARGIETDRYLPARIMGGGAYVYSLDGVGQTQIADSALTSNRKLNSLMTMESATTLLAENKKLSVEEMKKAKGAVTKILSKANPPASELFAALVLQNYIKGKKFSFIPTAYAFETGEGFYQAACRKDDLTLEQYLGFARSAQLLGHDSIGESCLNQAKNTVAKEAQKTIANPAASLKEVMIALQNVQLVGVDDDSNLGEQLVEKSKEVATRDGKEVADDPTSSAIDVAKELQKMEAVGANTGPTHDALEKRVKDAIDSQETTAEKLSEEAEREEERLIKEAEANAISEEEIMSNAAMSAFGIAMLKVMGIEELDEASLKAKFAEMTEQTRMFSDAAYVMCKELDGEDCDKNHAWANSELERAETEGYRVAEEIGNDQSKEFETPEYTEENGDVEMYFEFDLTPTPEETGDEVSDDTGEYSHDEEYQDDTQVDYAPESSSQGEYIAPEDSPVE